MNFVKRQLFKIDSIAMGSAKGMILNGKYDSAWDISYFLAQRNYRKSNVMNFEIAVQLCIEILELNCSRDWLIDIVRLFTSSSAPHELQVEGRKLLKLLRADGMDDLAIKVQEAIALSRHPH